MPCRLDQALVALQTCIELDPKETEAFFMLIQTKIELKQFQEAIGDSEKLLKETTEDLSLTERIFVVKRSSTFRT